jgi:DNA invertase Pin-like site-specific DNA recombinase
MPQTGRPKSGQNTLPEVMRRRYRHYLEPAAPAPSPFSGGVHIYARVSTADQADDNKTSLEQQVQMCREAIASAGVGTPARIWPDGGHTGFSRLAERPVGKAMLAALRPGDTICVSCFDRFSRQVAGGAADIEELRFREIGIYFAETGEFVPPGSGTWDSNKQLILHMRMMIAENERAMLGARVARARKASLQSGYYPFAHPPNGYRLEADATGKMRLVEDDHEQVVIQTTLREYKRLGSIRAVTRALNKAGLRNREGRPFKDYSVSRILEDHGELTPKHLPGQPRRRKTPPNPNGNTRITEVFDDGVEAAIEKKIRDAKRVEPFIRFLVQQHGCNSYRMIADALNFHEILGPRGGRWYPTSVQHCLAALGLRLTDLTNLQHAFASAENDRLLDRAPQRPSLSERQRIRERYRLPPNPCGKVQRLLLDIISFRDQKASAAETARVLGISVEAVKTVLKKFPEQLGRTAERRLTKEILAAYAKGQPPNAIAKALGITVSGVRHRLQKAKEPLKKAERIVPAPEWLAASKRRFIELGQEVMVMEDVPPEIVKAIDRWHAGRRKPGRKGIGRAQILQIAASTLQGLPRDETAKRLGISLGTVHRVLDQLRKHMPKSEARSVSDTPI